MQCIWNKSGFTLDITWLQNGSSVRQDRIMSGQGNCADGNTYQVILSVVDGGIADAFVKGILGVAVGAIASEVLVPLLAAEGIIVAVGETAATALARSGGATVGILSRMGIPNPAGIFYTGTPEHGHYLDVWGTIWDPQTGQGGPC
jgi:hypothetical protein